MAANTEQTIVTQTSWAQIWGSQTSDTRKHRGPVEPIIKRKASKRITPVAINPFIVSTSLERPDAEARKLIRSHVMRGKNRWTKASHKHRSLGSWINGDHDPTCEELQHLRDTSNPDSLVPYTARHNHNPDPQVVMSVLSTVQFADGLAHPEHMPLFYKFFTIMKQNVYTIDGCMYFDPSRSVWFEYLARDAAYMYSVLFTATTYFDRIQNRTSGPDALAHLAKTLMFLQSNLENTAMATSESTISVVVLLAMGASVFGDLEAAVKHCHGMYKMIMMRGGLRSLSRNSQLQIKSCSVDISVSLYTGRKPLFFADGISWKPYLVRDSQTSTPTTLHNIIPHPDPRLVNVWLDMREFCRSSNIAFITGAKLDPEIFHEAMTSIQYRLLHLSYGESQPRTESDGLQEALRLSMLAFGTTVFLQIQGIERSYDDLAARLKRCILALKKPDPKDGAGLDSMLWILIVAGASLFRDPDDTWLKDCVVKHTGDIRERVGTWPVARSMLKSIMWIDCMHDKRGEEVYHRLFTRTEDQV